ncbi:hypothetical protein BBP40_006625, partial [Aspergillus hancockii]
PTNLSVVDENQETNWAVGRAKNVVVHLMERMGVSLRRDTSARGRSNSHISSADNDTLDNPHVISIAPIIPPKTASVDTIDISALYQVDPETAELDMDMIIQGFIMQRNYGMAFSDTWSPQTSSELETEEPGPVLFGAHMGFPSNHWRSGGGVSSHDMLFGFNGSGQDIP